MRYILLLLSIGCLIGGFHFRKKETRAYLEQIDLAKTSHFEEISKIESDRRLVSQNIISFKKQYADINKDYIKSRAEAVNAYWRGVDEQALMEEEKQRQGRQAAQQKRRNRLVNLDIRQQAIVREQQKLRALIERTENEQRQMRKELDAKIQANLLRLDQIKGEQAKRKLKNPRAISAANIRMKQLSDSVYAANDALRNRHQDDMTAKDKIINDSFAKIDQLDQAFDETDRAGAMSNTASKTSPRKSNLGYSEQQELNLVLAANDEFRKKHELHTEKTKELKTQETLAASKLRENSAAKKQTERSLKDILDNLDKQYGEHAKSITGGSIAGCALFGLLSLFGFMKQQRD